MWNAWISYFWTCRGTGACSQVQEVLIANEFELSFGSLRSYWGRLRSKLICARAAEVDPPSKRTTVPTRVADLGLLQQVSLTLFDQYGMPAWSIDLEGHYLDPLNVTSRRMTTLFAETMGTERPPHFTEEERQELVSKALAMSTVIENHPTIFMTEAANWIMFPVDDLEACCAIVLVR